MLYCHREMKEDPQMLELVLPECLGKEEVACAGEVARELGLKTEKVNHTLYCKCTLSKLCGVCVCVCFYAESTVWVEGVQTRSTTRGL